MTERFPTMPRTCSARQLAPTDLEFCLWAGEALPGEQMTYHRGFLAIDACPQSTALEATARLRLNGVAQTARWACEKGLVHLVQRRLGPGRFAYLALARPKPRPRRLDLSEILVEQEAA